MRHCAIGGEKEDSRIEKYCGYKMKTSIVSEKVRTL